MGKRIYMGCLWDATTTMIIHDDENTGIGEINDIADTVERGISIIHEDISTGEGLQNTATIRGSEGT